MREADELVAAVVGPAVPRRGGVLERFLGRAILCALRWRLAGRLPELPKFVMIAAPHTTNWDFALAMGAALSLQIDLRWLGKAGIFRAPLGPLMRRLGGIPVDRHHAAGMVDGIVELARSQASFVLALAPEGTRRAVPRWRSGFHRIAHGAGIPIVPVVVDWRSRTLHFLPPFTPSADFVADVRALSRHFQAEMGRYPAEYLSPQGD